MLYPLSFEPILQERVWGGNDLATLFGKSVRAGTRVGESWEIADRPEEASVVRNGDFAGRSLRWLMEQHPGALLGRAAAPQGRFPLLVKILDARELLSIQVHPPARVAAELGGEPKTEMWYVTHARPGAEILAGLRAGVSREDFERRLRAGTVGDCIHRVPVKPGDVMFLPSGRVHALGSGMVIYEIQQNSDTTYRVFDWNRAGSDGKPRELHVPQAMASIDFNDFEPGLVAATPTRQEGVESRPLVAEALFRAVEVRFLQGGRQPLRLDERPVVLGVVAGHGRLDHDASGVSVELLPGRFCLVPASVRDADLVAEEGLTLLTAEAG